MCPYASEAAYVLWSKACNYHRRSDKNHVCTNPQACLRRLNEAAQAEAIHGVHD